MSQFALDDQLNPRSVRDPIARRWTVRFVQEFRPDEVIKDDRVPGVLRTIRTPTFLTIDAGFCKRTGRDPRSCILDFALRSDEQGELPGLLRRVLRLPEFRTRAVRMGKVARVSRDHVRRWRLGGEVEHTIHSHSRSRRHAGG